MEENKIMTLHPEGKAGVNILKRRYDFIKSFIIKTVKKEGEISFKELNELAVKKIKNKFDGKIPWYIVTVKLDLEARDIIERIPQTSPHKIRLKKK